MTKITTDESRPVTFKNTDDDHTYSLNTIASLKKTIKITFVSFSFVLIWISLKKLFCRQKQGNSYLLLLLNSCNRNWLENAIEKMF